MELGDLMNTAKALNLSGDQKDVVKKLIKEAAGNKKLIAEELKKRGINIGEDQIDMVMKMADKL